MDILIDLHIHLIEQMEPLSIMILEKAILIQGLIRKNDTTIAHGHIQLGQMMEPSINSGPIPMVMLQQQRQQ